MLSSVAARRLLASAAVVVSLLVLVAHAKRNDRPIIGIVSLPTEAEDCESFRTGRGLPRSTSYSGQSAFATFYVTWLEAAGARVVPILYDTPTEQLQTLLDSINGVLFTGGELDLQPGTPYYTTAEFILAYTLKKAKEGVHFPLHGTCEGFQLLNILVANSTAVLTPGWNSNNISMPLNFTAIAPGSRMFKDAGESFEILGSKRVTLNLHHDGVALETFLSNAKLTAFFSLLSVNNDRDGNTFVSTIEARDAPITATQWHPERPQFEWPVAGESMDIDHSPDAVKANRYIADFFVSEARRNSQHFASPAAEAAALIYNWAPVVTGASYQCYIFN